MSFLSICFYCYVTNHISNFKQLFYLAHNFERGGVQKLKKGLTGQCWFRVSPVPTVRCQVELESSKGPLRECRDGALTRLVIDASCQLGGQPGLLTKLLQHGKLRIVIILYGS